MVEYKGHEMEQMMSQILAVRYTDLQDELNLCEALLTWALEHDDAYGHVFALAYLGDYYLAVYSEEEAGKYLLKAQELLDEKKGWNSLSLRIYSLLGIYYDIRADEQNAVTYYLKALSMAEKLQDSAGEAVVLNNLAFAFQRCHCFKEALAYYKKAYKLQEVLEECPFRSALLGNLAEVSLILKQYDEAKYYIEECERTEKDVQQREIYGYKNWCIYYLSLENTELACEYADMLLANQALVNADHLAAFEYYHTLCHKMMDIKNKNYSKQFLQAMKAVGRDSSLVRMKMMEDTIIRYSILFKSRNALSQAYRRFYIKNQQFQTKANNTVADAMKSRIYLDQLMDQTQDMKSRHQSLEMEVNHDELTGIYNRKFLENILRSGIEVSEQLSIIICDVDYFKEYNDFYGHIKGDVVLQEIAQSLRKNSIEGIYPCRYGGDEFVCVCKNLTEASIESYIKDVRINLKKKNLPHEKSLCSSRVTLSIGYVLGQSSASTELHYLFQLADQALYESKRNGRNTMTKYKAKL